ncbi:MAG TPA: hypothetical protein VHC21_00750 [Candidatus Saccharimonadales bacterium]|nr:hypothetical protein [Candidatus Saccharimonadales bacterium]
MAEEDKQAAPSAAQQPGQVIAPGGSPSAVARDDSSPSKEAAPEPSPTSSAAAPASKPPAPTPASAAADSDPDIPEDRKQLYQSPIAQADHETPAASAAENVSWTASEFVAHEKSAGWYGGLIAGGVVIAAGVYLLTRDIISTVVVLVCAAAFGILGGKKPRQLHYHLDSSGITVGSKRYTYEMFRSFSVATEGAFSSIVFMPLKRFAPLTTIYYAPEDEPKIIDILSARLPFEEHKDAAIDSLMKRVRF